jgi:antitoxin HigA-1
MPMKKPPHPGRIVRQECLEPLKLTIKEAARRLGVSRQAFNNVVNEKAGVSLEMAIRLSKAFGSSPEV